MYQETHAKAKEAHGLFIKGYEVREIMKLMGRSRTTIYRYFQVMDTLDGKIKALHFYNKSERQNHSGGQ